jgi:hypothetical protein
MSGKAIGAFCHDLLVAFLLELHEIRDGGIRLEDPEHDPHEDENSTGAEPL